MQLLATLYLPGFNSPAAVDVHEAFPCIFQSNASQSNGAGVGEFVGGISAGVRGDAIYVSPVGAGVGAGMGTGVNGAVVGAGVGAGVADTGGGAGVAAGTCCTDGTLNSLAQHLFFLL
jgi:hypothetical protein